MAQQNIDFGTFPDDPSADPIRIAFQKVQQNFNEVYNGLSGASVTSVNRSAGAGITVNAPTGNVVVSANIASISFSSTTLKIGTTPNPITNTATYTSYSQTLYVELPSTVTLANLSVTGNITAIGNISVGNANLGNAATASYFIGSGNNLSNIQGANVSGTVANATYAISSGTAVHVTDPSQPNITATGTLVSLSVSGNANIGNIGTAGIVTATGNVRGGNLTTGGAISATGNANVGNLGTDGLILVLGNITGGNILTDGIISATGNANTGNIGATNGVFTNVSGNGSALTSITGANVTGQVANALVSSTVYTNAQPNITSTGTLSSLSVSGNADVGNLGTVGLISATGNITGGNLITGGTISATGNANVGNIGATNGVFTNVSGDGSALTSITGANVTGQVANALVSSTVYTAAQPNITSTGTLASLSVSGNANIGNIGISGLITATGNLNAGNIITTGIISATGNGTFGNVTATTFNGDLSGNATTAGTVTTAAQPNITSTGTLTSLSVSGNANIGNIGTNGLITATGTIRGGNLSTGGTLSVTGNTTLGNLSVTGTLVAGDVSVNGIEYGTSNVDISNPGGDITMGVNGTPNVVVVQPSSMYVAGTIVADYIVSNNTLSGTLASGSNAQPNITSLGTLTGLTVSGVTNLGSNSNVKIGGGAPSNTYLTTDGAGNLSWSVINNFPPGGLNTYVQFNDSGAYGGNAGFTFNTSTGLLSVPGGFSAVGNANVGNIGATNIVGTLTTASQTNITAVGNLAGLTVIGNSILDGNLNTANTSITGLLSVTGNANVSNIGATNAVFANVSGNGNGLSSLQGSNVVGTVANATYAFNSETAVTASTVTTNAQPNITSTGILVSLSVSGNANIGNIGTAGQIISSLATGIAPFVVTSTTQVANLNVASANNATNAVHVTDPSQPNITATGTLVSLSVSGNANVGNIGGTNGVFTNVSGNGSALTSITGANVTGQVSFAATANSVAGANVSGQVSNALVAGTVYTGAQPNVTSVGTLSSLSVSGNANVGNIGAGAGIYTSLSASGNITGGNLITGGLITVTGNVTGANIVATTYDITGVATGISAAGSSQGDATVLAKAFNVVSTVSSGQGVTLPTAVAGMRVTIINTSANTLIVYPATSGAINALSTNTGYSLPTLGRLDYIATSTTQWYTMGAIYV